MIKTLEPVAPPSRMERFTLRLMILLGVCSTGYLLLCLFRHSQVGYAPFYWVLMAGITFNCLRLLHEWYHYFSISIPATPPPQHAFTVDIFTTFCAGEPHAMIVETLTAIQAIRYPHTTYLCDEANDPYLAEVCRQLGVVHVTRSNRINAKAGNINNALQYATGELCVVLDPDHVPAPDFLDHIVHHFNNPEVGFVQVVQAYSNMGDSLVAKGAAQQTFQFYGPIMATMNSYGTVLAIGANCTFRRAALNSIGGHAAGLAEDMHTAMQLHAKQWKSVYVPAVLTRGLVPSTLSAYYAQQLKWSRGVFELFVTTYPKLFSRFTWRQRLHYGTIPFHYFSGVVFFINFLIPILSLITGLIPFRMDMVDFALLGLPVIASVILVRHFVQRWVMEETERGFHIVGGLLFIGTWWVHILGLVYTLLRKKVPYIPTPKDDSGPDNWRLNIPNLLVLLASAGAIVYGLSYDLNPYSLVMAGIAGINCLIMIFNIIASLRPQRLQARFSWVRAALVYPLLLKKQFWLFRHLRLYVVFRKLGLPLLLAAVCVTLYVMSMSEEPSVTVTGQPAHKQNVFYTGIYEPGASNGLTDMHNVRRYQRQYQARFNIISLYVPWGEAPQCYVPDTLVQAIYRNGSLPMITWEPWATLFRDANSEQKMLSRISAGVYDGYLQTFAQQVKALNRPVYLRFAHEADNPAYPWSPAGNNTPEEFKAAWQYVHGFFARHHVHNVIWVWNPWSPEAAATYFPGKAYVDWIGVTCLNYGPQYADARSRSFTELYTPFHRQQVFRTGLPVMVAEMGSLAAAGNQAAWLTDAFSAINTRFPEIHAAVLFNSDHDQNLPRPAPGQVLNWQLQQPAQFFAAQQKDRRIRPLPALQTEPLIETDTSRRITARLTLPDTIRGINYRKGDNWFRNLHSLTRREVSRDISTMKTLGINTIKRYGPGVYDRNILAVAAEEGIDIHYGFWVPNIRNMHNDAAALARLEQSIISTIKRLQHNPRIKAWNIGNNAWQQLNSFYDKPALLYQQKMWMDWLKKMTRRIKATDPTRPLTLDVQLESGIAATLQLFTQELPFVDAFGLVTSTDTTGLNEAGILNTRTFISQISVQAYTKLSSRGTAFIAAWQDLHTRDFVTFNGLTDRQGRYKPGFYQLGQYWQAPLPAPQLPRVRILRPARTTHPGTPLTYRALLSQNGEWALADSVASPPEFEWYLLKTDGYGNTIFLKELGKGASITVTIPDNPAYYRLYVEAVKGNDVTTAQSTLNTPLVVN